MEHTLKLQGEIYRVKLTPDGDGYLISSEQGDIRVESVTRNGSTLILQIDGKSYAFKVASGRRAVHVSSIAGGAMSFERLRAGAGSAADDEGSLHAPMAGTVLRVFVNTGDSVEKGSRLMILEAMKMEHEILAPVSGTITAVNFTESERCQQGDTLVEIEAHAESGAN